MFGNAILHYSLFMFQDKPYWSETEFEEDNKTVVGRTLEWLTLIHFILSFTSILSFWNRKV